MDPLYADLHIHSCLSPCADEDMTPANICAMAALKGLQLIAVTDHNSGLNLPGAKEAADSNGLILIPGIEVTTREEVHLLAYFARVLDAVEFGRMLRGHLPKAKNRPALFGSQIVMDGEDNAVGEEDALLIGATDLPLDQLVALIRERGGVPVPAHINRGANGLLINLGFVPPALNLSAVEVWRDLPCPAAPKENRVVLHSSDAHHLGDILEPEVLVELPNATPEAFLQFLRGG